MTCIICGTPFTPIKNNQICCSKPCSRTNRLQVAKEYQRKNRISRSEELPDPRTWKCQRCGEMSTGRLHCEPCRRHKSDRSGAGMEGISVESGEWYLEEADPLQ